MKIGFVVSQISFGGGERILQTLIQEFDKCGNKILLYTYNNEWKNIKGLKYKLNVLSCSPIGLFGKLKSILELRKCLSEDRPDCVVVFSLGLAEVIVVAGVLCNIPVITSERVDPRFLPVSRIHRFLKKITFRLCSGIVFQTDEVKNLFSKQIQNKSIVLPNPIMDELPDVSFCRKKEIVAIGRLSPEKNFDMLIKAFAEVKNDEYRLFIYGDGPERNSLHELIIRLRLQNRVQLMGNVDKVVEHIKCSDIFVLCSSHEGMPNALIEAMAMGLACIATDVPSGGCRALLKNKINGILVPVNSYDELLNALNFLIINQQEKESIQKESIKIRSKLCKNEIIPQWVNYIHSIIYK